MLVFIFTVLLFKQFIDGVIILFKEVEAYWHHKLLCSINLMRVWNGVCLQLHFGA